MDNYLIEHLLDLSRRSLDKNIFTFSDFLSEDEQAKLIERKKELAPFTFFGGAEGTQRNIVRFGSEDCNGRGEDFPVLCIRAQPLNLRFAETLTHRDILGALMSLGIERSSLGDIVVKPDCAYIFCVSRMAPHILDNLIKIKHTDIKCGLCDELPEGSLFETKDITIIISSMRADCVTAALTRLSRGKTEALFNEKKVFINGAVCEKADSQLKPEDKLSVRGIGKFIIHSQSGTSKKGRIFLEISKFV